MRSGRMLVRLARGFVRAPGGVLGGIVVAGLMMASRLAVVTRSFVVLIGGAGVMLSGHGRFL